jgi:predicted DsbA family dithiol-disulfide isomerase
MREVRIEVVSDVICPWCFIGKRRLEKALALLGSDSRPDMRPALVPVVRWLPFQLNPNMPVEGMPRAEYRAAKFGSPERARSLDARVAAEGRGEGIEFAFERIERTPNTMAAHRLIALAQAQGLADSVVDALFKGYFEEGQDIGDADVLDAIAKRCSVPGWPQAGAQIDVGALEDEMRGHGISAVPTFIFGRKLGVSGAHPPESLAGAMREALAAS